MLIEIWMEGFRATGQEATATKIWEGEAESFDDAVLKMNEETLIEHGVGASLAEKITRDRFISDEAFENRDSNWHIWACHLYDNEKQARKSFG